MKDKDCPICGKTVRSDAKIHEFCKLCGMGIPGLEFAPKYKNKNGDIYYFCCDICLGIYYNEIDHDISRRRDRGG